VHGDREGACQPARAEPDGGGERQLQGKAEPERAARQQERQVARMQQRLEMLLAREAHRGERRDRAKRRGAGPSVAGEPDEPEQHEHGDDLRSVLEVAVSCSGGGACRPVGDGVSGEDAHGRKRERERPDQGTAH
jgi:hypothetical protein